MEQKIRMNFFGEEISSDAPKDLASLRTLIIKKFFLSKEDSNSLVLVHEQNSEKKSILTEADYKTFLELKEKSAINIEINEAKQEQDAKAKEEINQLKEKNASLDKELCTKFVEQKKQINGINKQIMELKKEKNKILKAIWEEKKKIIQQKKENTQKINQIKKQLNLPKEQNKKTIKNHCKFPAQRAQRIHKMRGFMQRLMKTNPNSFRNPQMRNSMNEIIKNVKTILSPPSPSLTEEEKRASFRGLVSNTINMVKSFTQEMKKEKEKEKKNHIEKQPVHYNIQCDGCKVFPIVGKRFKCKTCPNFDYCEKCHNELKQKHGHEFNLISKPVRNHQIHNHVHNHKFLVPLQTHFICDGCGMKPIKGTRYHCDTCKDFDFCEECYEAEKEKHGHSFTKKNSVEKIEMKNHPCKVFKNYPSLKRFAMNKKNLTLKHNNTVSNLRKIEEKIIQEQIKEDEKEEMKNLNQSDDCIHRGIKCQGCGVFPIVGCRFKCIFCDGFDYCEDCEKKYALEHGHPFLKIRNNLMKNEKKK